MQRINTCLKAFILLVSILFLVSCTSPHRLSGCNRRGDRGSGQQSSSTSGNNSRNIALMQSALQLRLPGLRRPSFCRLQTKKEPEKSAAGRPDYGNGIDEDEIT